jgi:hypothetical protein
VEKRLATMSSVACSISGEMFGNEEFCNIHHFWKQDRQFNFPKMDTLKNMSHNEPAPFATTSVVLVAMTISPSAGFVFEMIEMVPALTSK